MKKTIILFFFILIVPLRAYERSMLDLHLPSELEPWQMQFTVRHRFYQPIDEFLDDQSGANVGLGLRYAFPFSLEASVQYLYSSREWLTGVSYHQSSKKVGSVQIEAYYLSLKPSYNSTDRESGLFVQLALKGPFFFKRITPVMNAGYDTYLKKPGLGLGVDLALSKKIALIAEYYPSLNADHDEKAGTSFGIVFKTYGHHFIIQAGNNTKISTRRLMRGTTEEDFFLGFTIHRLLGS